MPEDDRQPLSRRQLLTDAFPRGLARLAGGLLRARADLAGLSDPGLARIRELQREADAIRERYRREHPEWFAGEPGAGPDAPDEPADPPVADRDGPDSG